MHAIMCHDQFRKWYLPLLHAAERLRYVELGTSLLLNFLELDVRGELGQSEFTLLPINLEDGQVRHNGADHPRTGKRKRAVLHDLRSPVLVYMVGQDNNLGGVGVSNEIHCATHALEDFAGDHVVSQVAVRAHLKRAEHADVDVTTADHTEGFTAVEDASAGDESDGLLAGVEDVGVDLFLGRVRAHTEDAVLRLDPHIGVRWEEGWCESWHANTKVNVVARLKFLSSTLRDTVATGESRVLLADLL